MSLFRFLIPGSRYKRTRPSPQRRDNRRRLFVEALEDRTMPSTFTVLNLNDSGPDSLRAAIMAANANHGPDVIQFAPGLTGTITLASELSITDDLTINGPGANQLRVSGNHQSQVFTVASGDTVSIAGLTIQDGNGANGGGIYNLGGTLTVTNSTLSDNSVVSSGGAIYNLGGTLTVSNSTLTGNSAVSFGGGIFNDGTVTVTNSTLAGNSTAKGGGIYNHAGPLSVFNSTLSGNSATFGGGIFADGGTLTVSNSTLSGNTAVSSGGGILNTSGATVSNSTLTGNSAINGGGIENGGTLTVSNSTLSGNSAAGGGGIANFVGIVTVSSSTLSGNSAQNGSGIENDAGTVTVTNSTLSGNSAEFGGGIFNFDATLTVTNSTLAGNSAQLGGGIYNYDGGSAVLVNTIVANSTLGTDLYSGLGSVFTGSYDLIGDGSNLSSFTHSLQGNPLLASLGNYGGPTQTMTPLPGSPAIDAGDDSVLGPPLNLTTDQRGFPRKAGAHVDMGAVEVVQLTAAGQDFAATAGAPFSGVVATFTSGIPNALPAQFSATITWGDGNTSAGGIAATGPGTFSVSGTNTYADPRSYAVSVLITDVYDETASAASTATVTSLGQGIRDDQTATFNFWHSGRGQALLASFNGGASATALSSWLATNFTNLYGTSAGSHNLTGRTNAQVATFFQALFAQGHDNLDVQVLATALNVYATTTSLGGAQGLTYGFRVTAEGLGASSFNVHQDGAAFGVVNGTTLNVFQLLKAVNRRAVNGVLYNGDAHLRDLAEDLFERLNRADD
jgi:hypothetical protein